MFSLGEFCLNDRKFALSVRCGPPDEVFFGRFAGTIAVNVTWQKAEMENIIHFAVRYRAQGSWRWSEVSRVTPPSTRPWTSAYVFLLKPLVFCSCSSTSTLTLILPRIH